MFKILRRSKSVSVDLLAGIDPSSKGLKLASDNHIGSSATGVNAILDRKDIKIVFDATSAHAHLQNAPLLKAAGKIVVDLTPAAIGPYVIPVINLNEILDKQIEGLNVNLITCGGQATIPIVKAISEVTKVTYSEIVATIASKSAGPGTRQNIDEFTVTTANGIVKLGGADKGKAIILLNPAEPPIMMTCTIFSRCVSYPQTEINDSVNKMVEKIQQYVPGYKIKVPPQFYEDRVAVIITVEGAGDYLPQYAGNLDIMTSAAQKVGELIASRLLN